MLWLASLSLFVPLLCFFAPCRRLLSPKHRHQCFTTINHSHQPVRHIRPHYAMEILSVRFLTSFPQQHRILLRVYEHKLQQYEYKWAPWLSVIALLAYSKQQISKRCGSRHLAAEICLTKWVRGPGWQSWATERSRRGRWREESSCQNRKKNSN